MFHSDFERKNDKVLTFDIVHFSSFERLKQCYSEQLNVWKLQVKSMFCLTTKELILLKPINVLEI